MTIMTNKPKTTFIHIPKTGGTSISQWLITQANGKWMFEKTHGGKHATISLIRKLHPHDLGYTFVSIRNPWDRLVSGYHYYRKRKKLQDVTFEQFIHRKDWHSLNKAQAEYFELKDVQAIIRVENMNEDFKQVQEFLNRRNRSLTRENRSTRDNDYRQYYINNEMIETVARRHAADIQRFGYKFE